MRVSFQYRHFRHFYSQIQTITNSKPITKGMNEVVPIHCDKMEVVLYVDR